MRHVKLRFWDIDTKLITDAVKQEIREVKNKISLVDAVEDDFLIGKDEKSGWWFQNFKVLADGSDVDVSFQWYTKGYCPLTEIRVRHHEAKSVTTVDIDVSMQMMDLWDRDRESFAAQFAACLASIVFDIKWQKKFVSDIKWRKMFTDPAEDPKAVKQLLQHFEYKCINDYIAMRDNEQPQWLTYEPHYSRCVDCYAAKVTFIWRDRSLHELIVEADDREVFVNVSSATLTMFGDSDSDCFAVRFAAYLFNALVLCRVVEMHMRGRGRGRIIRHVLAGHALERTAMRYIPQRQRRNPAAHVSTSRHSSALGDS